MEISVKRATSLTGILIALIILLDASPCRATSIVRNEFYGQNNATIADNLKLEYFLDDNVIGRMLVDELFVSLAALNRDRPAVTCDRRGTAYGQCLPPKNKPGPPPSPCSPYNRDCHSN